VIFVGVTLGGHILLSSLNVILYLAGYNILPLEINWFPVDLKVLRQQNHLLQHCINAIPYGFEK
jgi:hypothetical protein